MADASMNSRIAALPARTVVLRDFSVGVIDTYREIPVDRIVRSPFQVRAPSTEKVANLILSIDDNDGLSSPILVRPIQDERYELVCGEARWTAYRQSGRTNIQAIVRILSDVEACRILAADNLQRNDLTDWEVCLTINQLVESGAAKTDAAIARIIGRDRSYVTKTKAFNTLPPEALKLISNASHLFGTTLIHDLKAGGYCAKHPALVVEVLTKVINGSLTQAGVISWLRNSTTASQNSPLRETSSVVEGRKVKISVYPNAIRISALGVGNTPDIVQAIAAMFELTDKK